MQNTRNIHSISNSANNHQSNTLIQPLLSIAKASTPVRTRLVTTTAPINSTPINTHKIGALPHKSPNNKENLFNNHTKNDGPRKTTSHQISAENRLNLSPIIALNKKLNEGPSLLQKKSLTPQGVKISFDQQDSCKPGIEKNYHTIEVSKSPSLMAATNFSDLRISNSFKNLIDPRCRTVNSGLLSKKNSNANLKESVGATNSMGSLVNGCENKAKLVESRSFNKFKPFNSSSSDTNQARCMNNDGKKAKYRVVNQDNDGSELYYCSKCTIPLVQQGFIVQEMTVCHQTEDYGVQQSFNKINSCRIQLQTKRTGFLEVVNRLSKIQQQNLSYLNNYYQRILSYIKQQQCIDNRTISQYYNCKRKQPIKYIQDIEKSLFSMNEKGHSPFEKWNQNVDKLLQINEQELFGQQRFDIQPNQLVTNFTQHYEEYLGPKLSASNLNQCFQINKARNQQSLIGRTNPMRFSFQKLLTDINSKKSKMQSIMNPLQEEDEEEQTDNYEKPKRQTHTAFRDLFPEEDNEQVNNDIHSPTFKHF